MDRGLSSDEPPVSELLSEEQINAVLVTVERVLSLPPGRLSSMADNPTMNRSGIQQTFQQISPVSDNSNGTLLSQNCEALGDVGNQQSVAAAPAATNKPAGSSGMPNDCDEFSFLIENRTHWWNSVPLNTLSSSTSVVRGDVSEREDHHQNNYWDIQSASRNQFGSHNKPSGSSSRPAGSEREYMMPLRNRFNAEAPFVVDPGSSGQVDLAGSHSGSRVPVQGSKDKVALPARGKSVARTKITTSGSEQSDDDELDGEKEMTQNIDPTRAKYLKRRRSNRDSARRSRLKRKAHVTELETQLSRSNASYSDLLKDHMDMSTKYNAIVAENKLLKANFEIIGAKLQVKLAEMSEICKTMPSYSTNADTGSRNADTGCRPDVAE